MMARNLFGSPAPPAGSGLAGAGATAEREFHELPGFSPGTRGKEKPIEWLPKGPNGVDCVSSPIPVLSPQQENGRTCGPCCLLRLRNQQGSARQVIQPGSPDWVECVRINDGLKDRDDMERVARTLDLEETDYCLKEACSSNEMLSCLNGFIARNGPSVVGVNAPRIGGHYIVVLRVEGTKVWFFDPYHGVEARWEFYGPNGFYNALVGSDGDDSVQMMAYRMMVTE